jgi:predicted kinase
MATIHLLHGFVGSGKTTFAKKLEQDLNCVRFTSDEWMIALYGDNPPVESFSDYYERVSNLIWRLATRILETGGDVIIDSGAWKRAERDLWRERADKLNVALKLYALQCPEEVMKSRVLARTARGEEGALIIDENAINEFKARFEPVDPSAEECIIVKSE